MKNIILIVLSLITYVSFGQNRTTEKQKIERSPNLILSYFGNWNYPGVKLGSEFMLRNVKINPRKGRSPKVKQSFLTLNTALYDHYEFRTNVLFQGEYLFRKTYSNGLFAEYATGLGVTYRVSKQVPTYRENTDGSLSEIKPKRNYFAVSFLGGVGYDFEKAKQKPIKIYFRTGLLVNPAGLIHAIPITEVGIITNFSTFKKK
jgi:hypothetical protein